MQRRRSRLCVPGDMLANNNRVESCMQLSNTHEDGTFREQMYAYDGGAVSGSHLVYDAALERFVCLSKKQSISLWR